LTKKPLKCLKTGLHKKNYLKYTNGVTIYIVLSFLFNKIIKKKTKAEKKKKKLKTKGKKQKLKTKKKTKKKLKTKSKKQNLTKSLNQKEKKTKN
jgi:mannitol-specific phosphotransferase system IIBC component